MGIPLSVSGTNLKGGILDLRLRAVKEAEAGQELLKIKVTRQGFEICLTSLNGQVIKSLNFV